MKYILCLLLFPIGAVAQCWGSMDAGSNNILAITNNGTLLAWGSNNYRKLGIEADGVNPDPAIVAQGWIQVATGNYHSAGIKSDGSLWTWGANYYGQGGQGLSGKNTPLLLPSKVGYEQWRWVSVGLDYTLAIHVNGALYAMGTNQSGQLGIGNTIDQSLPTQVGTATNWKQVSANSTYSLGLKTDGTLWIWGNGFLGNGPATTSQVPIQIGTDNNWNEISRKGTFAIKSDHTLWGWGENSNGQLGDSTSVTRLTPTRIGSDSDWLKISSSDASGHTLAIRTDQSLWGWGSNAAGQLGLGANPGSNIPLQIGSSTNWIDVATGAHFSAAVNSDGELFTFGENASGQLGLGNVVNGNLPAQVSCQVLGTDPVTKHSFNIYPNPAKEIIHIKSTDDILIERILVLGQDGKVILDCPGNHPDVNIRDLNPGLYILQLFSKSQTLAYKFIKL